MSCNCNKTYAVPAGAVNLNMGVYQANKVVNLYFKTATGRQDVYTVTCDGTGNIQLPMPALRLNTPYDVFLAEQTDTAQSPKDWQVNSTTISCLSLQFVQQWEADSLTNPAVFAVSLV